MISTINLTLRTRKFWSLEREFMIIWTFNITHEGRTKTLVLKYPYWVSKSTMILSKINLDECLTVPNCYFKAVAFYKNKNKNNLKMRQGWLPKVFGNWGHWYNSVKWGQWLNSWLSSRLQFKHHPINYACNFIF